MSVKHLVYEWERSPERGASLLVLLALADYADEHGVSSVSVAALAERARVSDRHVTTLLRGLVESGAIAVTNPGGGSGKATYALCADTSVVRLTQQRTARKARASIPAENIAELFEYWKSRMHKSDRTVLDSKRKKRLEWALSHYSMQDCKDTVDWYAASDFHMGRDPLHKGQVNNGIELIFRDAAHAEKFKDSEAEDGLAEERAAQRIATIAAEVRAGCSDRRVLRGLACSDDEMELGIREGMGLSAQ